MRLALLVLRCSDIEKTKAFYELLGMEFKREKHGSGAVHYACEQNDFVLELYPGQCRDEEPVRLGFEIESLDAILPKVVITEEGELGNRKTWVTNDPDNRTIELYEKQT